MNKALGDTEHSPINRIGVLCSNCNKTWSDHAFWACHKFYTELKPNERYLTSDMETKEQFLKRNSCSCGKQSTFIIDDEKLCNFHAALSLINELSEDELNIIKDHINV